jgi:hypothetical protein
MIRVTFALTVVECPVSIANRWINSRQHAFDKIHGYDALCIKLTRGEPKSSHAEKRAVHLTIWIIACEKQLMKIPNNVGNHAFHVNNAQHSSARRKS